MLFENSIPEVDAVEKALDLRFGQRPVSILVRGLELFPEPPSVSLAAGHPRHSISNAAESLDPRPRGLAVLGDQVQRRHSSCKFETDREGLIALECDLFLRLFPDDIAVSPLTNHLEKERKVIFLT